MTESKIETKELSCTLTEEERADRGQTLARKRLEANELREEAKESAKGFKERVDALDGEIDELAAAVDSGKEKRVVGVQQRSDIRRYCVETIRIDTLEVLETRAMRKEEIEEATQGRLFDPSKQARETSDSSDAPPAGAEGAPAAKRSRRTKEAAAPPADPLAVTPAATSDAPECRKCGEKGGHLLECPELQAAQDAPKPEEAAAPPAAASVPPVGEITNPAGVLAGEAQPSADTKH